MLIICIIFRKINKFTEFELLYFNYKKNPHYKNSGDSNLKYGVRINPRPSSLPHAA